MLAIVDAESITDVASGTEIVDTRSSILVPGRNDIERPRTCNPKDAMVTARATITPIHRRRQTQVQYIDDLDSGLLRALASPGVVAALIPAVASILVVGCALTASGCQLVVSERAAFDRDVPIPDAGPCPGDAVTWRATTVTVERPEGLMAFQLLLNQATNSDNLNFIIGQQGPDFDFDATPWSLRIGDGEPTAGGCYALSAEHPAALTEATVDLTGDTRPFVTADDVEFTVVAKLPFAVPLPLTSVEVSAEMTTDRQELMQGRVEGLILGEVATTTLLDLQSDGNPANDQPLSNFLGDPDVDQDGDKIVDDYTAAFDFISVRVGLDE